MAKKSRSQRRKEYESWKYKAEKQGDTYSQYRHELLKNKYNTRVKPLTKAEFNTVVAVSGFGGKHDTSPAYIAKRQFQGGLTNAELLSRKEAVERLTGKKFADDREFVEKGGIALVDDMIAKISKDNPSLSSEELALLVTRTIFSPS